MLENKERKYIIQKTKDLEVGCTINFDIGALPLSVYLSLYEDDLDYELKYLSIILERVNEVEFHSRKKSVLVDEEELLVGSQRERLNPIVKL